MAIGGQGAGEILVIHVDENGQAIVINAANNIEMENERDRTMRCNVVFDPTTFSQ